MPDSLPFAHAPERLTLRPERIDVWLACPDALTEAQERSCLALLCDDERRRSARFVAPGARRQYLAAHALLRQTLSRYADVRPGDWTFGANPFGRPHVESPGGQGLPFNLSHTDGLVAVAIAAVPPVGVDVETITRVSDLDALARSVFAPEEYAAFAAAPDAAARRELFFAVWTLKEAYIKARGVGLSLGLDGFGFDLSAGAPTIHFRPACPDDPAQWRFWRFRPTPRHALAVAGPAEARDVRVMWADPTAPGADAAPGMDLRPD